MHPLITLAKDSIMEELGTVVQADIESVKRVYGQEGGVFVTLKKGGELRGCIGRIISDIPVYECVYKMAKAAAFQDFRFSPLTKDEVEDVSISISLLTVPRTISSYQEIRLGKHGVILRYGTASSVFLPEVAVEQGWDLETMLRHLAQKAGLSGEIFRKAEYDVFESEKIE
ncbi:AMMECR1 domain-containing protein [Candidatus Marinamargulisbacteria bacterium SCGC AG-343-D04]|nr:AMMECR1 domain-containing protein [Candidatus Marinamargulisbacteria bacterium SCGC AG-343-D04]